MKIAAAPHVELALEPLVASEGEEEPRFRGSERLCLLCPAMPLPRPPSARRGRGRAEREHGRPTERRAGVRSRAMWPNRALPGSGRRSAASCPPPAAAAPARREVEAMDPCGSRPAELETSTAAH